MDQKQYDLLCKSYWDICCRAQSDPEYASLREQLAALESQCEAILSALPEPDRLVVETYITCRESMNRRMLEFACTELLFPEDDDPRTSVR